MDGQIGRRDIGGNGFDLPGEGGFVARLDLFGIHGVFEYAPRQGAGDGGHGHLKAKVGRELASIPQCPEYEIGVHRVAGKPQAPARIAEFNRAGAAPHPEQPTIGGVPGIKPLGAVIEGRLAHNVDIRVKGQNLEMDAADPMGAEANLAVGYGMEVGAERRAEFLKYVFNGIERDASHQM